MCRLKENKNDTPTKNKTHAFLASRKLSGRQNGHFVAINESDSLFRKPIATCPIITSYLLN
jgi:hypothetical protein